MKITIHNQQTDLPLCEKEVVALFEALLLFKTIRTDEVDLYFVNPEAMGKIHNLAFDNPEPTDCITFPMDPIHSKETPHYLGEAFLCPKVAIDYAKQRGLNVYEELSLYITHCFLHFLGFEDTTDEKAEQMRLEEQKCLSHLKNLGLLLKQSVSINSNG